MKTHGAGVAKGLSSWGAGDTTLLPEASQVDFKLVRLFCVFLKSTGRGPTDCYCPLSTS